MVDTLTVTRESSVPHGGVDIANDPESGESNRPTHVSPSLVYIAAQERSGSTLLDLLLGGSPFVQGTGEIERLVFDLRQGARPCTCGRPVASCPFWLSIQRKGGERLGLSSDANLFESRDLKLDLGAVGPLATQIERLLLHIGRPAAYRVFSRVFAKPHHDAVENSLFWYEVVRRFTGKPIVVDSSKNAHRMKTLYLGDPTHFKLIFLIRDGRAVTASALRRMGRSMADSARHWRGVQRLLLRLQASIPARRKIRVHYEALCQAPGPTLQAICRFIGIPYDESLLQIQRSEAHNIAGNPMRFRTDEPNIVLDERWKEELTSADLATFERIAGGLNRRLGYAS